MGELAGEGQREQLLLLVAGDLRERAVDLQEAARQRGERHADRCLGEGGAEALLGLRQGALGRLPLGQAAGDELLGVALPPSGLHAEGADEQG